MRYRSNLEEMMRLLRQHDVAVLLVTLPTVVRPGMSGEDLQRAHVFFPYFPGAYGVSRFLSLHRAYNKQVRIHSGGDVILLRHDPPEH